MQWKSWVVKHFFSSKYFLCWGSSGCSSLHGDLYIPNVSPLWLCHFNMLLLYKKLIDKRLGILVVALPPTNVMTSGMVEWPSWAPLGLRYLIEKSTQPGTVCHSPLNWDQTTLLNTALCLGVNRRVLSVIAGCFHHNLRQQIRNSSKHQAMSIQMKRSLHLWRNFGGYIFFFPYELDRESTTIFHLICI